MPARAKRPRTWSIGILYTVLIVGAAAARNWLPSIDTSGLEAVSRFRRSGDERASRASTLISGLLTILEVVRRQEKAYQTFCTVPSSSRSRKAMVELIYSLKYVTGLCDPEDP
jgi:hypothetical protein